jgi:hypothetical protein
MGGEHVSTTRLYLSALTSEYLAVRVMLDDDAIDPTGWDIEAAWTAAGAEPVEGDWAAASWEAGGPPYRALVLADKAAGTYRLWVRVFAPTETPVRMVALVDFE